MQDQSHRASLDTLQDIRNIMERSARFLSLSGWSGIWAGTVAIIGSLVAQKFIADAPHEQGTPDEVYMVYNLRFIGLALLTFLVAFAGAYYFTFRKAQQQGVKVWNNASRKMLVHIAIPMIAGGIFALKFMYDGHAHYIGATCLAFYGLALINGSKYTLTDIQYLGICEVVLACISLFLPGFGLLIWALGFGVLHILYGIIMWNKYDRLANKA